MSNLTINTFTDPTCPYAYSSEPVRLRLMWLYGDNIKWQTSLISLSGYKGEEAHSNLEALARNYTVLRQKYLMPINDTVRDRPVISIQACMAVVATKLNQPDRADRILRELRIAAMDNELVDDIEVLNDAAIKSDINPSELAKWMESKETTNQLNSDAEAARTPTKIGKKFGHKLSKTSNGVVRYSAPSYQFIVNDKVEAELPGFWPIEALEAIVSNLDVELERQDDPKNVRQVLEWAKFPLATAEVAAIYNKNIEFTRKKLENIATFVPMGQDGFWSL